MIKSFDQMLDHMKTKTVSMKKTSTVSDTNDKMEFIFKCTYN
jgi:hypothetical protein